MLRPDAGSEEPIFTDPSGLFRLDGVEPGVVTITARADGRGSSVVQPDLGDRTLDMLGPREHEAHGWAARARVDGDRHGA